MYRSRSTYVSTNICTDYEYLTQPPFRSTYYKKHNCQQHTVSRRYISIGTYVMAEIADNMCVTFPNFSPTKT